MKQKHTDKEKKQLASFKGRKILRLHFRQRFSSRACTPTATSPTIVTCSRSLRSLQLDLASPLGVLLYLAVNDSTHYFTQLYFDYYYFHVVNKLPPNTAPAKNQLRY